ncbi:MAG: POTRA domain-containing protein [Candidatus Sulfotelmatobacter sp.]
MARRKPRTFNAGQSETAESSGLILFVDSSRVFGPLRLIAFIAACFACLPCSASSSAMYGSPAQAQNPAKILASVKVKGTKRYKEEDVIAASGLQIGHVVGDEDFKKAARALGETGAFIDIAYSFSYSSAGTRLELQLTDAAKFLPAHFEDFVWFSDEELDKAIRLHVPLYHGEIPAFGRMADEVSDALQTMLVQNGIAGRVEYLRTPGPGGEIASFNYSVADVLIRIRNFEFSGMTENELTLLEAAAEKMPNREYSRSRIDTLIQRQLLPILRARGFLKASFGLPQPKIVKTPNAASGSESGSESNDETRNRSIIDVQLAVNQGLQYKLSGVEWAGNHEFPKEKLQAMISLKPGEPADMVRLGNNLADVKTLYGSRGYVNASTNVNPQFDDANSTVVLRIEVKEDAVYHMGDLEFRGLDNGLTAKLREAWKLRQGEVYDATYLEQYLPQANNLLPPSLDWEVVSHVTPNIRDKTVDVDLQYSVKAPK